MKTGANSTTILISALIVALIAYWYFFTGKTPEQSIIAEAPQENAAQSQFKLLVSQLQPITFNTEIFSDPRFQGLTDISTEVTDEPDRRPDPFAPISGVKSE